MSKIYDIIVQDFPPSPSTRMKDIINFIFIFMIKD